MERCRDLRVGSQRFPAKAFQIFTSRVARGELPSIFNVPMMNMEFVDMNDAVGNEYVVGQQKSCRRRSSFHTR